MPKINISLLTNKELRFALLYIFSFSVIQYAYSLCRDGFVEHLVIDVATVYPSSAFINFIAPGERAIASGHRILSAQGSISILNGCEGTETLFLLIAAIIAFPASWSNKIKGALLGTMLVYCLNQVRIVALFFSAQENRKWFDILHGYIGPSLIIVLSSLFFLWWANGAKVDESTNAA